MFLSNFAKSLLTSFLICCLKFFHFLFHISTPSLTFFSLLFRPLADFSILFVLIFLIKYFYVEPDLLIFFFILNFIVLFLFVWTFFYIPLQYFFLSFKRLAFEKFNIKPWLTKVDQSKRISSTSFLRRTHETQLNKKRPPWRRKRTTRWL